MADARLYSSLFTTLYDEPAPIGTIGRGTHYSILRAVQLPGIGALRSSRSDGSTTQNTNAHPVQDIAILWDEDHDARVIKALENIYIAGLAAPILFIGERKGHLSVLVDEAFIESATDAVFDEYKDTISAIADQLDDPWSADVGGFDPRATIQSTSYRYSVIDDSSGKAMTYLSNINNLWALGPKRFLDGAPLHSKTGSAEINSDPEPTRKTSDPIVIKIAEPALLTEDDWPKDGALIARNINYRGGLNCINPNAEFNVSLIPENIFSGPTLRYTPGQVITAEKIAEYLPDAEALEWSEIDDGEFGFTTRSRSRASYGGLTIDIWAGDKHDRTHKEVREAFLSFMRGA